MSIWSETKQMTFASRGTIHIDNFKTCINDLALKHIDIIMCAVCRFWNLNDKTRTQSTK